jgi:hypothetical protein
MSWCALCGADSITDECETCRQWWIDNPLQEEEQLEKKQTFICAVSFMAPMEGNIPIIASSKEQAEELCKKVLHNRMNVVVHDTVSPEELPEDWEDATPINTDGMN